MCLYLVYKFSKIEEECNTIEDKILFILHDDRTSLHIAISDISNIKKAIDNLQNQLLHKKLNKDYVKLTVGDNISVGDKVYTIFQSKIRKAIIVDIYKDCDFNYEIKILISNTGEKAKRINFSNLYKKKDKLNV